MVKSATIFYSLKTLLIIVLPNVKIFTSSIIPILEVSSSHLTTVILELGICQPKEIVNSSYCVTCSDKLQDDFHVFLESSLISTIFMRDYNLFGILWTIVKKKHHKQRFWGFAKLLLFYFCSWNEKNVGCFSNIKEEKILGSSSIWFTFWPTLLTKTKGSKLTNLWRGPSLPIMIKSYFRFILQGLYLWCCFLEPS